MPPLFINSSEEVAQMSIVISQMIIIRGEKEKGGCINYLRFLAEPQGKVQRFPQFMKLFRAQFCN